MLVLASLFGFEGRRGDVRESRLCPIMLAFSGRMAAAAMKDEFPKPVGPRIKKQTCGLSLLSTVLAVELPEVLTWLVTTISRWRGSGGFGRDKGGEREEEGAEGKGERP